MDRKLRSLAIAAFAAIVPAVLATAPIPGDPFEFEFTNDPAGEAPFTHDLGETSIGNTVYIHGMDGVHAQFPGTGNFVVDPDRNVKGKNTNRRFIKLNFPEPEGDDPTLPVAEHHAFFMSLNSVGLACDGSGYQLAPRDLEFGDCIRVTAGANEIRTETGEETPYFLRCRPDVDPVSEHTTARAECTGHNGDYCTDWDIYAADKDGVPTLTCALFHYVKQGKKEPAVFEQVEGAVYNMPFTAHVVRP